MKPQQNTQPHSLLFGLILLICFKLLHIMYTTNQELLAGRPLYFYFTSQQVYLEIPASLSHHEDCATKGARHQVPEYRFRIARHIANTCKQIHGEKEVMTNQFAELPGVSLNNMVIDKRRNYLYTAVLGAFGTKWSKRMVEVNKKDGESDNLVKVATFIQTAAGKEFLDHSHNLFKFYFVRNPLDRVISGYYYYFVDLKYAEKYLKGIALKELIRLNSLNPNKLDKISFEQYIKWVVHGKSAVRHFGVQSDIVQPCAVKYNLNGIFEIMLTERLAVANNILDLKTSRTVFTTVRDLTFLTREARRLVRSVSPELMEEFYHKYRVDYQTWNYSRPGHWFYPYPATVKNMRFPYPSMARNDWPKVKDISEEDLIMLEKGVDMRAFDKEKREEQEEEEEQGDESGAGALGQGFVVLVSSVVLHFTVCLLFSIF